MNSVLKNAALGIMTSPPVYSVLRGRALRGDPVTILCYHTLRPAHEPIDAWIALSVEDFLAQIAALRQTYDIVSLDAALEPSEVTKPRMVLSFDDGEAGLFDYLLPIVRTEALPVTVYVATRQIETGEPYWFDRVMNALQGGAAIQIELRGVGRWEVGPVRGKARWAQISPILEALKAIDPEEREMLADEVMTQAGSTSGPLRPLRPMCIRQLQELASDDLVTIGAHSHGHELLDQIAPEQARASIARSRALLREWTGQEVRHFAYPNGNYTPDLMALLDELGFASSTILEDRLMRMDTPRHALPRIGVGRYDSLKRLRLRLVGV